MNAVSCTVQWPALGLPIDLAAVTFANYLLPAQKTPSAPLRSKRAPLLRSLFRLSV